MAITLATLIENLGDMSISGVRTKLAQKPESINAADLPAAWAELPTLVEGTMTAGTHGGWGTVEIDHVIAVNATELGRYPDNYDLTIELMDNVVAALQAVPLYRPNGTNTANLGKGPVTWSLRGDFITLGQTVYWAIITTITARG